MGFLDKLGQAIGEEVVKQKKIYDTASESSMRKDDERLIKDFKDEHNTAKKIAMANELRRRGYGKQDD
jgi:hypothetical protein